MVRITPPGSSDDSPSAPAPPPPPPRGGAMSACGGRSGARCPSAGILVFADAACVTTLDPYEACNGFIPLRRNALSAPHVCISRAERFEAGFGERQVSRVSLPHKRQAARSHSSTERLVELECGHHVTRTQRDLYNLLELCTSPQSSNTHSRQYASKALCRHSLAATAGSHRARTPCRETVYCDATQRSGPNQLAAPSR